MVSQAMAKKPKTDKPVRLNPETHRHLKYLAARLGHSSIADVLDEVAGDVIFLRYQEETEQQAQEVRAKKGGPPDGKKGR